MKIKAKIAALVLAAATLATALIGCSAYNNPKKYLNIPDFKTLTVTQAEIDEELKTQLNEILESLRKADYEEVTDANYEIKQGDSVNVYYTGTPTDSSLELVDEVLEGMTNADDEEGYDLVIGSDSFIGEYKDANGEVVNKGFEEQLIGHKKGEKVDVIVTFPDDYDEKDLQGKEVKFEVTINSVSTLKPIDLKNTKQEVKVTYAFVDPFEVLYKDGTAADYTAKEGDKVNVTYKGTAKDPSVTLSDSTLDKLTNESSSKGTDVIVGSDSLFSKNFSEALVGMKNGEKKTIEITFAADYKDDTTLQGKVISFEVTANSVKESYERGLDEFEGNDEINIEFEAVEGEEATITFTSVFKGSTFTVNFNELEDNETKVVAWNAKDLITHLDGKELYYEHTFLAKVPNDPKTYGKYADEQIGLTMTVSTITTAPEWNDDTVAEYTSDEYTKVSDYEAYLLKLIKGDLAYKVMSENMLIIKYPKAELEENYESYIDNEIYSQFGDISGYTQKEFDKLISDAESNGKFSYAELYAEALAEAKVAVKERLVLEYLFKEYDIKVSNKTYKEKLTKDFETYYYYYATYYGLSSVEMLEDYYGKDYFMLQYKYEVLIEYLGENFETIINYEK